MLLQAQNLAKRYGAVWALRDASLELTAGTIHGLVGQNGAGKSTMVRLLAAIEKPDAGSVRSEGGVPAIVPQYPRFAPSLTVWQNIVLGREARRWLLLDVQENRRRVERIQSLYDLPFPLDCAAAALTTAELRRAALAAALLHEPQLLILDEPTAGIPMLDQQRILRVARRVAETGRAVLYISHDLVEVTELCDRVTVLREGISTVIPTAPIVPMALAEAMFGPQTPGEAARAEGANGRGCRDEEGPALRFAALELAEIGGEVRFGPFDFAVRPGCVAVLAGLREYGIELIEEYFAGNAAVVGGSASLGDEQLPALLHPRWLRRSGIAYVPSRRLERAATLDGSIEENVILLKRRALHHRGLRVAARVRSFVDTTIADFEIGAAAGASLGTLSGGNIHRVILSREVGSDPRLCVVSEPSTGLDLRGQERLRSALRELARRGSPVLVLTSRVEDALFMGDQVWTVAARGVHGPFAPEERSAISLAMAGIV